MQDFFPGSKHVLELIPICFCLRTAKFVFVTYIFLAAKLKNICPRNNFPPQRLLVWKNLFVWKNIVQRRSDEKNSCSWELHCSRKFPGSDHVQQQPWWNPHPLLSLSRMMYFVRNNLIRDTDCQTHPCRKTLVINHGCKAMELHATLNSQYAWLI